MPDARLIFFSACLTVGITGGCSANTSPSVSSTVREISSQSTTRGEREVKRSVNAIESICGEQDSLSGYFIPDEFIPPSGITVWPPFKSAKFYRACRKHDSCYDTLGQSRSYCDRKLYEDLRSECSLAYNTVIARPNALACQAAAKVYYEAVAGFGDGAYDNAQLAANPDPFVGGNPKLIVNMGALPGPTYLNGVTADGTVNLSATRHHPIATPLITGTMWEITKAGSNVVILRCLGHVPGNKFLDGLTGLGTVALASTSENPPHSGTRWEYKVVGHKQFTLKCLGSIEGPRYLDGVTQEGKVKLSPETFETNPNLSGTKWKVEQGYYPQTRP